MDWNVREGKHWALVYQKWKEKEQIRPLAEGESPHTRNKEDSLRRKKQGLGLELESLI